MRRFVINRLLWLVITAVCVAFLIFTVLYFAPGDPVENMLGETATEEQEEELRESLGLNDPYIVQLGRYLYNTFIKWDFGTSYMLKVPVVEEFAVRLPRTLLLTILSIAIDLLIGIPLGIMAAMNRGKFLDSGVMVFAMIGVSIPGFWMAILLVMLFTVKLGWLPNFGFGTWKHWVMPVISASIGGVAHNGRQTRSAVLETIRADYVTTARAKGLSENKVIYKHMLPNALMPIVSGMGARLASNIGGSIVIETVFSFPGIGTYLMNAITARDYPVIRGCVLILALFSAVIMLLTDLAYGFIDPRIKAQYTRTNAKRGGTKV
ncbi:MAG: ABC transporter permease [Oscillospiraceae bacterium]